MPHLPTDQAAPALTTEREQQRVAHLVLGEPRPKPKGANRRKKGKAAATVTLVPGIEERVQLRERWSHKTNGTAETHEHAAAQARREGALARLVGTGAIDAHQLAAADQIAEAYHSITAEVAVRTANLEPRSSGGGPHSASHAPIAAVIRERAYARWREAVAPHGAMLLAIIVDDMALTTAARDWRLSNRRARSLLVSALDSWKRC
ncbi:hypothetical protein [Sphingomonas sp. Leaf28]|uniref:hypothetical protein n=1 Tax=Sphingomonas sp. Leaf28 TaxID=1735695 RepID=UPI0012E228C9|nr:hypothetical protein [Sphingomonas sp. Leaf28]